MGRAVSPSSRWGRGATACKKQAFRIVSGSALVVFDMTQACHFDFRILAIVVATLSKVVAAVLSMASGHGGGVPQTRRLPKLRSHAPLPRSTY